MRPLRPIPFGSVLVVALCCGLVVASHGVGAYFADQAAGESTIAGSTLDAKLSESAGTGVMHDETGADTVNDTWEDPNHDVAGGRTVTNTLTVDATAADLDTTRTALVVTFVENDTGGVTATPGNEVETARTLVIDALSYDGQDLLAGAVGDENANGRIDLEDLTLGETATNLTALPGMASGGSADLSLTITGTADLLTSVRSADGIDIELRVGSHAGSLADIDRSRNNTIQYA